MSRRSWFALIGACGASLLLPATMSARAAIVCHETPTYRIVTRDRTNAVGTDILLRRRAGATARHPCRFDPTAADYLVGQDDAVYLLALRAHFLAVDVGTGPDRDLMIVDIETRQTPVEVPWDDAIPIKTRTNGFTYWQVGSKPIKPTDCPAAWRRSPASKDASAAHATMQMIFTFADAKAHATGKRSCTRTQTDLM